MTLETWNTFFAGVTLIVITTTAIIAIVQLRHLHDGNQLQGVLTVLDLLQDPGNRELLNFVRRDLRRAMGDPDFVAGLREVPIDRAKHPELYVCQLYEHIASYVRSGLIAEATFMQADWYDVSLYWAMLEPVIRVSREAPPPRPFIFENFEWLAAKAQRWIEKHPQGNYPKDVPRMIG